MKKFMVMLVAVVLCFGFSGKFVYAEGIESWLKGEGDKTTPAAEAPVVNEAAPDTAPLVAQAKKPEAVKAKAPASAETKTINNAHGLDQIIYKISRAQTNLEEMSDDLGGRKEKAIGHLKEALIELKDAR